MRTLLLINLASRIYGVWEDEVHSVEDVHTIHRLPLFPACIAGMAVIDNRTVTLADLSVCIGLPPASLEKGLRLLIMSETERVAGFVMDGEVRRAPIRREAVFGMPKYISTTAVDSCALVEDRVIPILNISAIYMRLQQADREPPAPELDISPSIPLDISHIKDVRLYTCGFERFVSSAEGIENGPVQTGHIAGIPLAPAYVKGVAVHGMSAVTVISLSSKMGLPRQGTETKMLLTDISGERFGFLVDDDQGRLSSDGFSIMPMPPLTASTWMRAAAVSAGDVLPMIDLTALMAAGPQDETPVVERYTADSSFSEMFGKKDVDVVEFMLLGARHALPASEVEDVLDLMPYRPVPNVQPIVAGVARQGDELLPVIDLAAVFGRKSMVTPSWKMILLRNGDFRALILTEHVFGGRGLPPEMHKTVPIVLPHSVVYGCYPEAEAVRLILNVLSLTVHFDRSLVKDFLGTISMDMKDVHAELLTSLLPEGYDLGEKIEAEIAAAGAGAIETLEASSVSSLRGELEIRVPDHDAALFSEMGVKEAASSSGEEAFGGIDEETRAGAVVEDGVHPDTESEHERQETEEQGSHLLEDGFVEAPDDQTRVEEEVMILEGEGRTEEAVVTPGGDTRAEEEEETKSIEAGASVGQGTEHAGINAEEVRGPEVSVRDTIETEEMQLGRAAPEADDGAAAEAAEGVSEDAELSVADENAAVAEREPSDIPEERTPLGTGKEEISEVIREAEEIVRTYQKEEAVHATPPLSAQVFIRPALSSVMQKEPRSSGRKWAGLAGIGVILAVLLIYIMPKTPFVATKAGDGPQNLSETRESPEGPRQEPMASFGITPPEGSHIETDVYIVKKGDTLWSISERFTGNPLNYPKVARENMIADPDLIFPNQKVRISREKQ